MRRRVVFLGGASLLPLRGGLSRGWKLLEGMCLGWTGWPWLPSGADRVMVRSQVVRICCALSALHPSQPGSRCSGSSSLQNGALWAQRPSHPAITPALHDISSQKHLPTLGNTQWSWHLYARIPVSLTVSQPFNVSSISGITQCVCSKSSISVEWWVSRMSSLWSDPSLTLTVRMEPCFPNGTQGSPWGGEMELAVKDASVIAQTSNPGVSWETRREDYHSPLLHHQLISWTAFGRTGWMWWVRWRKSRSTP